MVHLKFYTKKKKNLNKFTPQRATIYSSCYLGRNVSTFIRDRSNHPVFYALVRAKLLQSCLTLCNPMDCSLPGSSVHEDSLGKNTGVGCQFLLQGIFLTQESNLGLLHCRQILYQLSYEGRPLGAQ